MHAHSDMHALHTMATLFNNQVVVSLVSNNQVVGVYVYHCVHGNLCTLSASAFIEPSMQVDFFLEIFLWRL